MSDPNYYDLSGESIRVQWYPNGLGGPKCPGAVDGPVLMYTDAGGAQSISGASLSVSEV